MLSLGEMLIKRATELKMINGRSEGGQAGPRKGLSEEMRKKVISKRLKTALTK